MAFDGSKHGTNAFSKLYLSLQNRMRVPWHTSTANELVAYCKKQRKYLTLANEIGVYSNSGSIDFTCTIVVKHWFVWPLTTFPHTHTQMHLLLIAYTLIVNNHMVKVTTRQRETRHIFEYILMHVHNAWSIHRYRLQRGRRTFDAMVVWWAMRRLLFTQKHNNVHIINYVRGRKHINVSWHLRYTLCRLYSCALGYG